MAYFIGSALIVIISGIDLELLYNNSMNTTTRFEKMEWLYESCGEKHVINNVLPELINWIGHDDFNKFYERHCSLWDIKSPEELNELINS